MLAQCFLVEVECYSPGRSFGTNFIQLNVFNVVFNADESHSYIWYPFIGSDNVLIKSKSDEKCVVVSNPRSHAVLTDACKDQFSYGKGGTLVHKATGFCLQPYNWYGSFNKWHKVLLKGDCSSHASVFVSTSQGTFVHAASGYCLYNSQGTLYLMTCDGSSRTQFSVVKGMERP